MKRLGVFILILGLINLVYAAHYISGWVEDALDGEGADGKSIVMWKPSIGINDNLTDIIGVTGNSGVSGVYLMDCELLGTGCSVGNILSLMIFGDVYVSEIVNVTVSGAGYDAVNNITLNSPPNSSLIYPGDNDYTNSNVEFNYSFFDYDDNLVSVELWGNWSGWSEKNSTTSVEDGYFIFNEDLAEGSYKWGCYVEDNLSIGVFSESNYTFFVDTTAPAVWGVSSVNEICGFGEIPVECSASDSGSGIANVTIQTISPLSELTNYSALHISGNLYRANVSLDEVGDWGIKCFANDSVGNENYSLGENVSAFSGNPELEVVDISINPSPSVEGESINISVNISNSGCVASGSFIVGFFEDGENFENESASIGAKSFLNMSVLWNVSIGLSWIWTDLDLENVINEDNESNNIANESTYLSAWQDVHGNLSLDKILGAGNNMSFWGDEQGFAGNIFIADSEAIPEWKSLQAIGKTKTGESSSGDFGEIDSVLSMVIYNDSIDDIYSSINVVNFSVFQREIEEVPFVNSSANGNFITGILWDMSDSLDSEYDSSEKEDVVFVSKVNVEKVGDYGTYDYQIVIPSKLRDYDSGESETVYLYYDLN